MNTTTKLNSNARTQVIIVITLVSQNCLYFCNAILFSLYVFHNDIDVGIIFIVVTITLTNLG